MPRGQIFLSCLEHMHPDHAVRSRVEATVEALRYWVPTVADVARVGESEAPGYWRLTMDPEVEGACPLEMTLHENQHFDLVLGGELYEDRALASLELLHPLLQAVTEGRVVQRRWISCATGAERAVETIVTLADGSVWRDGRTNDAVAAAIPREATERHDHHFLPYRR
jgi:hypothetical protein